nr:sporulation protein YpjB [Geomicrobium halophilum]
MAIIFLIGLAADQEEREEEVWAHIDAEAGEILQLVQSGKYEDGRARLRALTDELTSANYQVMDLDVHDMGTIIMSYERLLGALTEASMEHDERVREAMRFHYVVDAVMHTERPKWKETENDVKEQLQELRESASEGGASFQHAWNEWKRTFEMIYPAATLKLSLPEREELRSLVNFMSEHSHRLKDENEARPFFDALEFEIDRLYDGEMNENDPSLMIVIAIISGSILLSLSYAGWKKYQGEKKRARARRER